MVAIGLGTPVYLGIQALIARFIYQEASARNYRSPLVVAVGAFLVSVIAAFVTDGILFVLLFQLLIIAAYLFGTSKPDVTT